jgi:phage terminase small subunit
MPVLSNPRHESFAQALAKGKTADEAYASAGFKPDRGNASRLQQKDSIRQRVAEILSRASTIEEKAIEKAIEKLAISKERIASELAKIGFADIRKAVRWGRSPIDTKSDNASPNGLGIFPVELVPSEEIDEDTAAAVAEVSLTQNGVKIKMYDKRAALVDLAKMMGYMVEKHEHTGAIALTVSPEDAEL